MRVTEFFACEAVRSDSCSDIREMAGPSEGMGVARGTGRIKTSVQGLKEVINNVCVLGAALYISFALDDDDEGSGVRCPPRRSCSCSHSIVSSSSSSLHRL